MRSIKLIFCWVERPSIEISALLMFFSLWFCLIVPRGKHKGNISELPWEKDIMKFASRVKNPCKSLVWGSSFAN